MKLQPSDASTIPLGSVSVPPPDPASPAAIAVVIEPTARIAFRLRDLWDYRELLYFLFWRDFKVRYKQTLLGGSWAILQPLATMIIFTVFLGRLAKVSSDGIPYSVFAFSGLLPWQLFSFSLTAASASLVGNSQLITKVYFPRLVIPVSAVLVGLVDFAIASSVMVVLMAYHHIVPTAGILMIPLFVLFAVFAALAVGLILSALNVQYRDVRHTIPFLIQIWMFATPIVYPSSLIPQRWRLLYGLNPMVGVVDGFRWALFGKWNGSGAMVAVSVASTIVLFVLGLGYFRRMERNFADLV